MKLWRVVVLLAFPTLMYQAGTSLAQTTPSPVIFADDFESGTLSRWDEVASDRFSVTGDPARVRSGNYALQGEISGDGYGEINKWFLPGYDRIYIRFDVLFEEGFLNQREDGNGMHFLFIAGNRIDDRWSAHGQAGIVPNGTDFFLTAVDPEQSHSNPALGPLEFYTYYPDMSCCFGNTFEQAEPRTPLVAGAWQEVIVEVETGTPGQADGAQRLWINGELKVEVEGIRWRDTADLRLNEVAFVNYMPGPLQTQHIWIDNVLVTTEFPGSSVGTPGPFADVPANDQFATAIQWLSDQSITRGCNVAGTLFCPRVPVTRGEMAAFLVRGLALPAATRDWFADDQTSSFQADINSLAEAGITLGCGGSSFCPLDPVRRDQMASFLVRAMHLPPTSMDHFVDDAGNLHQPDINSLGAAAITHGCGPGLFCPDADVTRGEMAAFLYRGIGPG
ncbi:MAG TPA: S-layer homology domain-containing protein [Acidimicrobiia bacterium]|jgi:hypothetical protein